MYYDTLDDYKTMVTPCAGGITEHYCFPDHPDHSLRPDYNGPDFYYHYNSMGFRGPELDAATPALASFGCSHTVGVGLPVENRFANLFADKLNLINYSFAVSASDNLSILRNVVAFLKNNLHTTNTKIILVAWSYNDRFTAILPKYANKNIVKNILPNSECSQDLNDLKVLWKQYCADAYTIEFIKTVDVLCKLANVECVQISLYRKPFAIDFAPIDSFYRYFVWEELDKARDYHYGTQTHKGIADSLYHSYLHKTIINNTCV